MCSPNKYFECFIICLLGITTQAWQVESLGEKKYGQYCSGYVDRSCNQTKYLICIDKRCDCRNPATMIYDASSDSCVTRLGSACYQDGFFLTSPKGYKDSTKFYQGVKYERKAPCTYNAICDEVSRTCICQNPLDPGLNGTCTKPPIGEFICDFDHMVCPAGTGLRCVDGLCQCHFPHLQYFNGTRCISRVGGPCERNRFEVEPDDKKGHHLECTPFAECLLEGRHHRCFCKPGYTQNKEGLCVAGFGQRCRFGTQCGSEMDGLKCVDGRCQCQDELHMYDVNEKRCKGLAGAFCQTQPGNGGGHGQFCTNNAFCAPRMFGSTHGACTCKLGYIETQNGTCEDHNRY